MCLRTRVGNELVHAVDRFTTLVLAGGGTVPDDSQLDGKDMRDYLLGPADESGRDTVLCLQGNRLQAITWRQRKMHTFQQDVAASIFSPYSAPDLHNLEWDPREEHEIGFPQGWVIHPIAARRAQSRGAPPDRPGHPIRHITG